MMGLTQGEAEFLLSLEKYSQDEDEHDFARSRLSIPLHSADHREEFMLDMSRGHIRLAKMKYQMRARKAVILARLDLHGSPHRNPDGEEIACPHLHVFREGFGDKWAQPLPPQHFSNRSDARQTFDEFLDFCTVVGKPNVNFGLIF